MGKDAGKTAAPNSRNSPNRIYSEVRFTVQKTGWDKIFLLLISGAAGLAYLWLGLARVFYPYALDLVEEAMVQQAWRIAQGLAVFIPPNIDFVPQVYMPLFTWLGGQLLQLTGFGFWPLRLLSFLSTVGTAVLIFYVGWQESGQKTAAFAGSALFLAGYRLVGGWYDLARVDALFTFLSLAGLVMLVYGRRRGSEGPLFARANVFGSAVLLGLALLTKQNGLLLTAVAGLYFFAFARGDKRNERRFEAVRVSLLFGLFFLLVAGLPILVWQQWSDGWLSYYVITIAYASPLDLSRLRNIFFWELAVGMGVLVGLALMLALHRLIEFMKETKSRSWQQKVSKFLALITGNPWLLFIGTAVFISVAGRTTVGGNLNNMLIGYAFLCLVPGLSWRFLAKVIQTAKIGKKPLNPGWENWARRAWVLAMLLQFGLVTFPLNGGLPQKYWPTAGMRAAGDALLAQVAAEPGEVWLLLHPSFAVRTGKRPYVHLQTLWHARLRGEASLPEDLVALIEAQHFARIISDESDYFETEPAFLDLLLAHYEAAETLTPEQSPMTTSGPIVRPLTVYIPRN